MSLKELRLRRNIAWLFHENAKVRLAAARLLGEIGDSLAAKIDPGWASSEAAHHAFIAALGDGNSDVRRPTRVRRNQGRVPPHGKRATIWEQIAGLTPSWTPPSADRLSASALQWAIQARREAASGAAADRKITPIRGPP